MFEWVKRLFRKEPEFDLSILVDIYEMNTGREKNGRFAKGNKLSPKLPRDKKGRFVRAK